jgi:hypothetical protein
MRFFLPYIVLGAVVGVLIAAAIWTQVSSIKLNRQTWKGLVSQLHKLNFDSVTLVARDFLEPRRGQLALEPEQMWQLVGGYKGLMMMRENANIMLALAAYAEQWNFDEGVIVTERMRREALSLRRAVHRVELRRLILNLLPRRFRFTAPFDVHEAASSYYLMRQRLLALYETSHAGLYPALAAVL